MTIIITRILSQFSHEGDGNNGKKWPEAPICSGERWCWWCLGVRVSADRSVSRSCLPPMSVARAAGDPDPPDAHVGHWLLPVQLPQHH